MFTFVPSPPAPPSLAGVPSPPLLPGGGAGLTALINSGVKARGGGVRRGGRCDQLSSGRLSLIGGGEGALSLESVPGGKLRGGV